MALIDRVKARYTEQKLIELTNKDDETATTIDDTRLGLAVTDTEAAFETHVGVAYDDTDARHVRVAVRGVIVHLLGDSELGPLSDERYDHWRTMCEDLAKVTSRARILPEIVSTDPDYDESEDDADFGRNRFADFIPGAPCSADDDDYE